jgi:hypothetical protein
MPLARPLLFEYPDDEFLNNHSDAYLWGNSFLVAPVVSTGQTLKSIYLPQGEWIDYYTDDVYQGSQSYNFQISLEQIPLFIKRGSIIPMQPVMNFTDEYPFDTLTLAIYPSSQDMALYSLYEDDGVSLEYQTGSYAFTEFSQNFSAADELTINIGASAGNFSGKLSDRIYLSDVHHMGSYPTAVFKNEIPLVQRLSYQDLRLNVNGYFYDENSRRLFVQIKGSTDSTYEIKATGIVLSSDPLVEFYPEGLLLKQNYPNPFNSYTKIEYQITEQTFVSLKVYDILGSEIVTLVNEEKTAGYYNTEFDASSLASGVYFYRLQAGSFVETKKMVLLR